MIALLIITISVILITVQEGDAGAESANYVFFILDASRSMMEPLEGRTKLEAAKEVLFSMLGVLPPDTNVGLVVYGHRNSNDCHDIEVLHVGKLDVAAMKRKVAPLQAKGETSIAASLEEAASELRQRKGSGVIVLLSDGIETCGGDPVEAARNLYGQSIDFTEWMKP